MEQVSNSTVEKTSSVSPITLDKPLYKSDYQKEGTITAQVRQVVTSTSSYPTKQISSNLQGSLFGITDFGFEKKDFTNSESRIAWIDVPVNATDELIKAKLDQANTNGARLYRILSNHPILTNHQQYSIQSGQRDMDYYANRQVVRYPENHPQAGQIVLDNNGKVQYRAIFFWESHMDDQDNRTVDPNDMFMSKEIAVELQGAAFMASQRL